MLTLLTGTGGICRQNNREALALLALDGLEWRKTEEEHATQTDEQGMFFAFNENPCSWAGLKVPAHVTVMEAFDGTGNHSAAVEEMKLWLLREKQTRQWNSPEYSSHAPSVRLNIDPAARPVSSPKRK